MGSYKSICGIKHQQTQIYRSLAGLSVSEFLNQSKTDIHDRVENHMAAVTNTKFLQKFKIAQD